MKEHRIFCEWTAGVFISSLAPNFQADLVELVESYGPPDKVEFRPHGGNTWRPQTTKSISRVTEERDQALGERDALRMLIDTASQKSRDALDAENLRLAGELNELRRLHTTLRQHCSPATLASFESSAGRGDGW